MSSQQSMPVTIPATKVRRNFGDLIQRTYSGREHFIVEKGGLPVVVIISMAEYKNLMKERERRETRVKRFEKLAREIGAEFERQGITEEQMMASLEETRERLFQERHGNPKS